MKVFECGKCHSKEVFIEKTANNTGLYCADCGKWITWLNKDDIRLAQRQIDSSTIPRDTAIEIGKEIEKHVEAIDRYIMDHAPFISNELMGIQNQCKRLGVVYF